MFKTARIAAVLALVPCLVAIPAHALSVKDWQATSDADQLNYLGYCVARLAVEIAKTDRPLALKIKSYYGEKPPAHKYTEGFTDLMTRIVQLQRQAETDKTVDLSKIEIEEIVLSTTAKKFALPATAADAFKDSDTVTSTRKSSPAQPATAPRSDASPARSTNATHPVIVGKIDVSHFAEVRPGDTRQQVVSIYGQPGDDQRYSQWWGNMNSYFMVSYVDNAAKTVEVYSGAISLLRSHGTNDALVDLIGQKEPAVVALLGPPTDAEEEEADTYNLYWVFPMAGHPAPANANRASDRTLRVRFKRISPSTQVHGIRQDDADCIWVSVTW